MKKNDLVLVIVCVFISGAFALILTSLFINPAKNQQSVEVVEPISPEFADADTRYFNAQSINPTQQIQIGTGANNQPTR